MKSRINELAASKNMSLYRLARMVGMTDRALYKYERVGLDKAQFGCMVRIAEALDCKLEDLYRKESDSNQESMALADL